VIATVESTERYRLSFLQEVGHFHHTGIARLKLYAHGMRPAHFLSAYV